MDFPTPIVVWRNSMMGIEFECIDSQLAAYFGTHGGLLVRAVQHGSADERAGIRAGDVIISLGQQQLSTERELSSMLHQRGSNIQVALMRDHKRVDVALNLR
jgi:serine protease Do